MYQVPLKCSTITSILILLLIASNNNISTTEADPDTANTTVTNVLCSSITYEPNGPYETNVANTLDDLANYAPYAGDYTAYRTGSFGGTTVYGYANCNVLLIAPDECFDCLDRASKGLFDACAYAVGACIEMVDCLMRYENYPFRV